MLKNAAYMPFNNQPLPVDYHHLKPFAASAPKCENIGKI
jgi:hypothetical protein